MSISSGIPIDRSLGYESAGVDTTREEEGLSRLIQHVQRTWPPAGSLGEVKLPVGYFANVVDIGGIGIAITTDGVGTKVLIAQMLHRYDTIGIDCVAMNVNDLLCVGATPVTMVDYLAVQKAEPDMLEQIAVGLCEGARQARVSIPGGEIAQMSEIIRGVAGGAVDGFGFDLAGSAIGTVPLDRILVGEHIEPGDVVIGVESNGVHSNGLTLARRALLEKGRLTLDAEIAELGRSLGDELLRPTHIYVAEALEVINSGVDLKALMHVTSDGLLNLTRVKSPTGYVIDFLPPPPAVFRLIQEKGEETEEEMFRVFNMGIGFCFVVTPADADRVIRIAESNGKRAYCIGHTTRDESQQVFVKPYGIVGRGKRFYRE
ncbi:MAG: purM [Chloroflexi bacterium]|nr:purM [Chloroflexota bacterium]